MAKSSKTIQMAAVAIVAIVAVAAIGFVLLGNQDDTPALEKIKKRGKAHRGYFFWIPTI